MTACALHAEPATQAARVTVHIASGDARQTRLWSGFRTNYKLPLFTLGFCDFKKLE